MQETNSAPTHPTTSDRLSTTLVMSIAATAAAMIAIFGDENSFSVLTVAFALVGLAP